MQTAAASCNKPPKKTFSCGTFTLTTKLFLRFLQLDTGLYLVSWGSLRVKNQANLDSILAVV